MTLPDLTELSDDQLAGAYTRAVDAVRIRNLALEPFVVERLRRLIAERLPEAHRVTFTTDTWDNGVFLTVDEVFDADGDELDADLLSDHMVEGPEDPAAITLNGLLADLTDLWGTYADELLVNDPQRDIPVSDDEQGDRERTLVIAAVTDALR